MSNLRIRVELNKGRIGIPLGKLSRIAEETVKFLVMACEDAGIAPDKREWLASNFENNSVDFDCETVVEDDQQGQKGREVLRCIFANDFSDPEVRFRIRPATRHQYARMTTPIDSDEKIRIGLYQNGEAVPEKWFSLTKQVAAEHIESAPEKVNYHGEIQGIIHAFYKESDQPKLVVRELVTSSLVNCFFKPEMYRSAVEVLMDPDAVVFVSGEVTESIEKGQIESIVVSDFRPAPEFDLVKHISLLGAFPTITGNLSTEDFIRDLRDNEQNT